MALFTRGKTLYFPGPMAEKLPHVVQATRALLIDLGVDFIMKEGMVTSGYHAWFAGYADAFSNLKKSNEAFLRKHRISAIITNDPHEAFTFREAYGLRTQHLVEVIVENITKIKKKRTVRVSYHHPCFLDRLDVRERSVERILRRAGFRVDAAPSRCCGSVGDDYARNNKEVASRIAKRCAAELGNTVVTCCPYCNITLSAQGKKVIDISEALS